MKAAVDASPTSMNPSAIASAVVPIRSVSAGK